MRRVKLHLTDTQTTRSFPSATEHTRTKTSSIGTRTIGAFHIRVLVQWAWSGESATPTLQAQTVVRTSVEIATEFQRSTQKLWFTSAIARSISAAGFIVRLVSTAELTTLAPSICERFYGKVRKLRAKNSVLTQEYSLFILFISSVFLFPYFLLCVFFCCFVLILCTLILLGEVHSELVE